MKESKLFDIQRFSVHDGPGIRTVIFFKGCNLNCSWCHNPESIKMKNQIEFYSDRCIGCDACFDVCKESVHSLDENKEHQIDRESCTGCLNCADNCFAEALVGVGREMNSEKLLDNILTDREYFNNSGGGVTFSGGECMLQIEFLEDILKLCKKENLHTAIDTAGNVPWSFFEKIIAYTDLFLLDIKAADTDLHKTHTGADNNLILENIKKLSEIEKEIIIRIPLIIGVNDTQIEAIGQVLKPLNIKKVEVLPFHKLGEHKYAVLGIDNTSEEFMVPTDDQMERAINQLKECGVNLQ